MSYIVTFQVQRSSQHRQASRSSAARGIPAAAETDAPGCACAGIVSGQRARVRQAPSSCRACRDRARHSSSQRTGRPRPGGRRGRWWRQRGKRACCCGAHACASGPHAAVARATRRCARRGHGRGAEQRAWQAGACRACRADDPRCCGAARAPRRRARMCGRVWAAVSGVGGGAHGPRAGRAARASSGGLLEQMGRRPGRPGTGGGCRGATGGPGGAAPRARGLGGRAGSGQGERRGGRRLCARQASDQPPPALTVCAATASAARRRALPVARHACSGFRGAQCCRRRAHGRQYPLP